MVETYPQVLIKNTRSDAAAGSVELKPKAEFFSFSVK